VGRVTRLYNNRNRLARNSRQYGATHRNTTNILAAPTTPIQTLISQKKWYVSLEKTLINQEKTWFVLCDTSYPPDTQIELGQLITHHRTPAERLGSGPLDFGQFDKLLPETEEFKATYESSTRGGSEIGLSATILGSLPFDIAGHRKTSQKHAFDIDKVVSKTFVPSEEYVLKSMQQDAVLRHLARHGYRKAVYMIVGIKIGSGAQVVHQTQKSLHGKLSGTLPGMSVGIPVDVGAHVSGNAHSDGREEKHVPGSFVFAYRLREIRYSKKAVLYQSRPFIRGADLHELHNIINPEGNAVVAGPQKFLGTEDEIDIDGISGVDFEEDEDDSQFVDGCFLINFTGS